MSQNCEPIICCPPVVSDYLAGGGGLRQEGVLYNVAFKATTTAKVGPAAVGINALDFWNTYTGLANGMVLKDSTGLLSAVTAVAGTFSTFGDNGNSDPMVRSFAEDDPAQVEIGMLPGGTYDLYVYGWNNQVGSSGGIPLAAGDFKLFANAAPVPPDARDLYTLSNANPPPWAQYGNVMRFGGIVVNNNDSIIIQARTGSGGRKRKISGFQLIRSPAPEEPGPGRGQVVPDITTGARVYFMEARDLIAGRYRVTYNKGAFRYGPTAGWTVDYDGALGYEITHSGGVTLHGDWVAGTPLAFKTTQAEAEISLSGAYVDFNHTGGQISMRLVDTIYADNIAGAPNPTFSLSRLD